MSLGASLVAQLVKNSPAMRETWVQSLGWEDPLEKGMATHCSIPMRVPWTEEPGGLHGSWGRRVRHDWATFTSSYHWKSTRRWALQDLMILSRTSFFLSFPLCQLHPSKTAASNFHNFMPPYLRENQQLPANLVCFRLWCELNHIPISESIFMARI